MVWILWASLAWAEVTGTMSPIPETIVRLSVFDLAEVTRSQRPAPRLPANYGQTVAEKISQQQPALLECLARFSLDRVTWQVDLEISPQGLATPKALPGAGDLRPEAFACVEGVLRSIVFSKHPLTRAVSVSFPLSLQRKSL